MEYPSEVFTCNKVLVFNLGFDSKGDDVLNSWVYVPDKEYIHMEASIEYIKEGGYYLLFYEKGFIRAWGAIKVKS